MGSPAEGIPNCINFLKSVFGKGLRCCSLTQMLSLLNKTNNITDTAKALLKTVEIATPLTPNIGSPNGPYKKM